MHPHQRVAVGIERLGAIEDVDGDRVALQLRTFTDHLLVDDIGEKSAQAFGTCKSLALEDAAQNLPDRLVAGSFDRRHRLLLQVHSPRNFMKVIEGQTMAIRCDSEI
ncbi:hypothetical protein D3C86_1807850 [compost metagenome]